MSADPSTLAESDDLPGSSLEETMSRLERRLAQRAPRSFPKSQRVSTIENNVIQLPFWPEQRRGVPNDLVRGALFTVGNVRVKRSFLKNSLIATLSGIEIRYTGEELRQDDQDVFLQIVHLARLVPLGSPVTFTAHAMLQSLKWHPNVRSYTRLRDTITRLKATGLEVRGDQRGYSGSLIRDFTWKNDVTGDSSRVWGVRLEPEIAALFNHVAYSQIEWEQRLALGHLAKWLHSFYHTHRRPLAVKVDTIRRLCGSATKDLSKFRQLLRDALQELLTITFLTDYTIDPERDLVHVVRATSNE
ncbi:plasmid replication initiator TrfA [uncultured Lamprocystis sp.]|jgi:hypothetical protein|uniref:plasmid replication initiator TrfA n=1 Tax=uncultured Lamprocystis sp. TaxID=543132 RepID=UPI0025EE1762|nr:plasmid replication initiator TrfA [uncultured Lamprocystis sp.]